MREALDTDLDAYLDRELSTQPAPEVKPAERLHGVLALAAEEEQWLRALPGPGPAEDSKDLEGGACPIPEHLQAKPAAEVGEPAPAVPPVPAPPYASLPAPLPGLAAAPHLAQPGWAPPMAPAPGAEPPRRTRSIAIGALVGVGAAGVLAAGVLWMVRGTMPGRAEASAPVGTATAVRPAKAQPAREPVPSVESSPLPRRPEPLVKDWSAKAAGDSGGALPGPVAPGRRAATQAAPPPASAAKPEPAPGPEPAAVARAATNPEPKAVASVKVKPSPPSERVQARRAPAVQKPQPRREVEEELPFQQKPPLTPAPAQVAKATARPPAPPKESPYSDLDEEFAKELGFTDDSSHRKAPESKGPKSVWIPPAPSANIAERLTPADIQQVVVANRPAIASCTRRHGDALTAVQGGEFVVRWFVHPSGSTYGVAMDTRALRGTSLATCLEGLVKGWKFLPHRVQQQEPIRFPFRFQAPSPSGGGAG